MGGERWVGIRVVYGIIISSGGWGWLGGEKVGRDMGGLIRWVGMVGKDLGNLRHTQLIRWVGIWLEEGKVGRD